MKNAGPAKNMTTSANFSCSWWIQAENRKFKIYPIVPIPTVALKMIFFSAKKSKDFTK